MSPSSNILPVPSLCLVWKSLEGDVTIARKLMMAMLLAVIGIGAAACEFGQHRGSHSTAYPDDARDD